MTGAKPCGIWRKSCKATLIFSAGLFEPHWILHIFHAMQALSTTVMASPGSRASAHTTILNAGTFNREIGVPALTSQPFGGHDDTSTSQIRTRIPIYADIPAGFLLIPEWKEGPVTIQQIRI